MVWAVRFVSLASFAGQVAFLSVAPTGARDSGALIFFAMLSSALLLPFFLARRGRHERNVALLVGFVPAALGAIAVISGSFSGTNSTAALDLLLLPFVQALCFGLALAIGRMAQRDHEDSVRDRRLP
jgi:FtsH-binding integral membrane protein